MSKRRYDSPAQEAYLAMWRCYDRLRAIEDEFFAAHDLTAQQYNVLRLLRASHPQVMATAEIVARLISRAPDMTRMLDKLEARSLLARERSREDRRAILVRITPAGVDLLKVLSEPLRMVNEQQLGHMNATDLAALTRLLRLAATPHEPLNSPWTQVEEN